MICAETTAMHPCYRDGSNRLYALRFLRLLAALLLATVLTGCAGANKQNATSRGQAITVYVVSHGWHTGIVIARRDLGAELAFLDRHFDTANWYEIGWGDREFYQAGEVTTALMLRAGLWPTDTVLHVTALPEPPDTHFTRSRVIELQIDTEGLRRMTAAIADYFRHDENGGVLVAGEGLYGDSLFFEATGRFHAFNTCNTWTAKMLNEAGIPIRTVMTVRADSVMSQLEALAVSDTGER